MSGKEAIFLGIVWLLTFIWGKQGWNRAKDHLEDLFAMEADLRKAHQEIVWWNLWFGPESPPFRCGHACGIAYPYGFVPEDGCPVHDVYPVKEEDNDSNLRPD